MTVTAGASFFGVDGIVADTSQASEGTETRVAAIDPILMRMHTMAPAFGDFAGHFIRHRLKH